MRGRSPKGRKSSKGRKSKGPSKAVKSTRGRSSKSKKASKSRKTSKTVAKKKVSRKTPTVARKKATRKTAVRVAPRGSARKDILGEGNYTASREFRREETGFVARNKNRIPELGERAAEALDSSEGNELRQAEETARSHSVGEDES